MLKEASIRQLYLLSSLMFVISLVFLTHKTHYLFTLLPSTTTTALVSTLSRMVEKWKADFVLPLLTSYLILFICFIDLPGWNVKYGI